MKARIRVSAIIVKNNKVLLIHRRKQGREYWVFPGGGIEKGETPEEAIIREVKEETGLEGKGTKFAFWYFDSGIRHPFYFVEVDYQKPKLGGPEVKRNSSNNWYSPEWIKKEEVENINLVPKEAKKKLVRLIKRSGVK